MGYIVNVYFELLASRCTDTPILDTIISSWLHFNFGG